MAIGGSRSGILSLTIKDKAVLYAAYMPFIKNGGLFIPTNKQYKLGEEVFLLLNLMERTDGLKDAIPLEYASFEALAFQALYRGHRVRQLQQSS